MANTIIEIVLLVIICICLFVLAGLLWVKFNRPGIAAILVVFGVLFAIGGVTSYFEKETQNEVTIHFLETDTYVIYENARVSYMKGNKYVITEDGQRIQIVNAEITVSDADT